MARKKARDLDSLIRLNSWIVDERRRELGVLVARDADLVEARAALDRQMVTERAIASADPASAGFSFGAYAGVYRARREQLAQQRERLAREIEAARERLAAAFRQLKVYEEVRKTRARTEAEEEAHREQQMLDEIALNQFRRSHSN